MGNQDTLKYLKAMDIVQGYLEFNAVSKKKCPGLYSNIQSLSKAYENFNARVNQALLDELAKDMPKEDIEQLTPDNDVIRDYFMVLHYLKQSMSSTDYKKESKSYKDLNKLLFELDLEGDPEDYLADFDNLPTVNPEDLGLAQETLEGFLLALSSDPDLSFDFMTKNKVSLAKEMIDSLIQVQEPDKGRKMLPGLTRAKSSARVLAASARKAKRVLTQDKADNGAKGPAQDS